MRKPPDIGSLVLFFIYWFLCSWLLIPLCVLGLWKLGELLRLL